MACASFPPIHLTVREENIASDPKIAESPPMASQSAPPSPKTEIDGLPYFPRLCAKVRLFAAGELHPDLHDNLGLYMDLWVCQFLGVEYDDLKGKILSGATDAEALAYAKDTGTPRNELETSWFRSYLLTRGFRDDLSERLALRVSQSAFSERRDILTFCDYIDADEGRNETAR